MRGPSVGDRVSFVDRHRLLFPRHAQTAVFLTCGLGTSPVAHLPRLILPWYAGALVKKSINKGMNASGTTSSEMVRQLSAA